MTYINDTSNLNGFETPIGLSTLSPPVLNGFGQTPRTPGSLTNFNFLPNWQRNNSQSPAGGFNNFIPLMSPVNFLVSPASFNVDFPGSSAGSPGVDSVTTSNTTVNGNTWLTASPTTGDVVLNGSAFQAAVESLLPSSLTAYETASGESGGGHSAVTNGTNLDFNGDATYIETEAGSGGITHSFVRNLYEQFQVGGTVLTPSAQNDILEFEAEAGSNVEVTTGTDKIIVGETVAPLSHSTLQTDDGTVTASQLNDSVKFTNVTTSNVVKSILGIDGNNGSSQIEFNIAPDPAAGFGTQLVKIENSGAFQQDTTDLGTPSAPINYVLYFVTAYSWNPDSGSVSGSESGFLRDYSTHLVSLPGFNSTIISGASVTTDPARWPVNTILSAQKVSSTLWVRAGHPLITVTCG